MRRFQPAVTWMRKSTCGIGLIVVAACNGIGGNQNDGTSSSQAAATTTARNSAAAPAAAAAVGYNTLTFGPAVPLGTTTGTWQRFSFPGNVSPPGGAVQNPDGSIALNGISDGSNGTIGTAVYNTSMPKLFQGIAFGGGGYFEAVLKFDGWRGQAASANNQVGGWPSFWGMAVEHFAQDGEDQVPGQVAGYENFIEMDFLEYNIEHYQKSDYVYSGSLINWYGKYKTTCAPDAYCGIQSSYSSKIRQLPDGANFSDYHAYGALWVPATDTSNGYIQGYFDGAPIGRRVSWSKLRNLSATPPTPFGIADLQHLVLILGTGTQYPMTVSSVSVWQHLGANNLIY